MATQTLVTFEGLSEGAAEKLAAGMADVAASRLTELLDNAKLIESMSEDDVKKMSSLIAAVNGNGNCGWGCSGA